MAFLTTAVSLLIAIASGSALYHSASSIPKLRKYEEKAEKAAEWSSTAEKRLWDTRYTVGAGLLATVFSMLSAVAYLMFLPEGAGVFVIGWPILLAADLHYSGRYMRSFWNDKAKIPMMDEYNAAISDTTNVMGLMDILACGWAVISVLKTNGL